MMKVSVCCHLGESGCLPLRYVKPDSLFRVAGFLRLRQQHLQCQGAAKTCTAVFVNILNRKVAHRPSAGTLPYCYLVKVMLSL